MGFWWSKKGSPNFFQKLDEPFLTINGKICFIKKKLKMKKSAIRFATHSIKLNL
jgi:hypothetical protein